MPQQYADLRAFRQTIFSAVSQQHAVAAIALCAVLLEYPNLRNIEKIIYRKKMATFFTKGGLYS